MKCDTSVTGKIGCFGSTFGHLTYQNLEFEGCMLGTLSQGMSKNSFHHQQNNWWKKTVFLLPPNHVFQLAHFIGEIADSVLNDSTCLWTFTCIENKANTY